MTTLKKSFALSLALLIVFTLSVPVLAHDTNAETSVPTSAFDWKEYEDELTETEYNLKINIALESEVNEIVIHQLIEDGIIPEIALFNEVYNEEIFLNFVEKNVHIEYFNSLQRAAFCCEDMNKWVHYIRTEPSFSNNICIQHKEVKRIECSSCDAIWDTINTYYAGCGGYRYSSNSALLCPYVSHLTNT